MPRYDDDDEDDALARPKKKGLPAWAWLLIAAGVFSALAALLSFVAVGYWVSVRTPASRTYPVPSGAGAPGSSTANAMSREEFDAAVLGKTQEQIKQSLGVPDWTSSPKASETTWTYRNRVYDRATGKTDSSRFIVFKNGVAYKTH